MSTLVEIRPGRRINLSIYKSNPLHPTIFMVHGMGGRGYQWREQVRHLKDRYTLVVPDLLGQGESEKPWPGQDLYCFEELNKDIQVLFENYASAQNYVFGHSYGGALATFLAKEKPNQIQKLILITPVSCQPFTAIPFVYSLPVPLVELLRPYLDKAFEKLAFAAADDPSLLKIERQGRALNPMPIIKALMQGMKSIPRLQMNELKIPSLIISGSLDKLIPVKAIRACYGQLPQHQLYVLENAAHMVHLEKSQEVNRLIDIFLER